VGGAAQLPIIKKLSGGIRIALAQYRELAAFSQFASDLDEATRRQLERGKRVTELMKQKQYVPLSVAEMALSLYAVDRGYMDDIDVDRIVSFEDALHKFMREQHQDFMNTISESGDWNDEVEATFKQAIEAFKTDHNW
jgi:F-type H+-transporting ATPase subunit alpha